MGSRRRGTTCRHIGTNPHQAPARPKGAGRGSRPAIRICCRAVPRGATSCVRASPAPAAISPGSPSQCTLPKRNVAPLAPPLNKGLAALVPVALKSVDVLHARCDLGGQVSRAFECGAMVWQVGLGNAYGAGGVHACRHGEMVGRDHGTAPCSSGADVVFKRGATIGKLVWVWQSTMGA